MCEKVQGYPHGEIPQRRTLLRGGSARDSPDQFRPIQEKWPESARNAGRIPLGRVAGFTSEQWPVWPRNGGRIGSEYTDYHPLLRIHGGKNTRLNGYNFFRPFAMGSPSETKESRWRNPLQNYKNQPVIIKDDHKVGYFFGIPLASHNSPKLQHSSKISSEDHSRSGSKFSAPNLSKMSLVPDAIALA